MTGVPLLAGLVSIAAAIGLGVYLLAGRRVVPAGATALDGDAAGRPSRQRFGRRKAARPTAASADEAYELPSVLRRFGGIAARLTPSEFAGRMQRRLDLAGNPPTWSPERLMAFKGLGLVTGVVLGFLGALGAGFVLELVVALALGAAGLFLPDVLVKNIGDKRQTKLQQQLPDAMDMLTVCVEAGLGFDAALARVARNTHGAVAEECARVLQEMQFGLSRADAMRALSNRTNVVELRSFVSAMIQSAELGISIGDVLREQSKEMRIKRRQRAEEQAQKLQVKLLLPLITCLLPAMFIVVLGPAVMNIMTFFHQVN